MHTIHKTMSSSDAPSSSFQSEEPQAPVDIPVESDERVLVRFTKKDGKVVEFHAKKKARAGKRKPKQKEEDPKASVDEQVLQ